MASFIYSLLYGYRLQTGDEPELREAKKVLEEYEQTAKPGAYLVDAFPALNYLPRPFAPWKDKADQLYEQQANLHLGNLAKALQQEETNVAKLMHLSQEAKNMTEVELAFSVGVVSGFMLSRDSSADVLEKLADAAIDTSAMTLNWLIIAALTNGPEWLQKAQSILDKVVGRDRLPPWEDRPELIYIDAINKCSLPAYIPPDAFVQTAYAPFSKRSPSVATNHSWRCPTLHKEARRLWRLLHTRKHYCASQLIRDRQRRDYLRFRS